MNIECLNDKKKKILKGQMLLDLSSNKNYK